MQRGSHLVVLIVSIGLLSACSGAANRVQAWEVEDRIQAIDGQIWVVGTQLVTVSGAKVAGTPEVGAMAHINGQRTAAGELRADRVEVIEKVVQPTATPERAPVIQKAVAPTATPAARPKPAVKPAHNQRTWPGDDGDSADGDGS